MSEPRTMTMTISLGGVLQRAAEQMTKSRDWRVKSLSHELLLLEKHINMVRDNPAMLQEFLDLWVKD